MPTFSGKLNNYMRQMDHAYSIALQYEMYARSIGCMVNGDELEATPAQAMLLDAKWRELTVPQ